jgi:hypothetical protein
VGVAGRAGRVALPSLITIAIVCAVVGIILVDLGRMRSPEAVAWRAARADSVQRAALATAACRRHDDSVRALGEGAICG